MIVADFPFSSFSFSCQLGDQRTCMSLFIVFVYPQGGAETGYKNISLDFSIEKFSFSKC
jgi:hypothetical protein